MILRFEILAVNNDPAVGSQDNEMIRGSRVSVCVERAMRHRLDVEPTTNQHHFRKTHSISMTSCERFHGLNFPQEISRLGGFSLPDSPDTIRASLGPTV